MSVRRTLAAVLALLGWAAGAAAQDRPPIDVYDPRDRTLKVAVQRFSRWWKFDPTQPRLGENR